MDYYCRCQPDWSGQHCQRRERQQNLNHTMDMLKKLIVFFQTIKSKVNEFMYLLEKRISSSNIGEISVSIIFQDST